MTAPRTREDVVRAAGRLFAERGFHGTSMRDLGQEVGLMGSSLYSHIGGKAELLVEVIRRGGAMFQAVADEVMSAEGSAAERLHRLMAGHVQILTDHADEATTFLNEARFLDPQYRDEVVQMRDRYEDAFRRLLEEGAEKGELRLVHNASLTAIFILSVLNAMLRWYRPDGPLRADEIADRMWSFVVEGVG